MAYIFLDESGDLGFDFSKKKTSKYFVVTFLFTREKRSVEKIAKKIFKGFSKKEIKLHGGALHCYKEQPRIRIKVLKELSEKNVSLLVIYLNKKKVYTRLQDEKHILYNYVTNILLDRLCTKKLVPIDSVIHLIASRRETNTFLNENFKNYLINQIDKKHKLDILVAIKTPAEEKSLQIVDFASWAVFRKHERGDEDFYNLIKRKVVEENPLFP